MKRRKQNYHLKTGITRRKKKNTKKNPHTKLRWKKRDFRPCRLCGKAQTKISENRPAARRGLTKRWKFKRLIQNYLYGHNVNLSSYYLFVTYSLISLKALQTITQVLQFLPRTIAALQAPSCAPSRPGPALAASQKLQPSRALHNRTYLLPEGSAPPRQQVQKDATWQRFAEAPECSQAPSRWRCCCVVQLGPPGPAGNEGTCRHLSSPMAACITLHETLFSLREASPLCLK